MDSVYIDKPKDWPINNKEVNLERIMDAIDKFCTSPAFENKGNFVFTNKCYRFK